MSGVPGLAAGMFRLVRMGKLNLEISIKSISIFDVYCQVILG